MRKCFLTFWAALWNTKIIIKFLVASLKTLPYSIDCSKNASEFLFLSLSLVNFHHCICQTEPAFGTIFRILGDFLNNLESHAATWKPEQASWRVLRIFRIIECFHRSEKKLIYYIFSTKWQSNFVKTISAHPKSTNLIFKDPHKKYSARDIFLLMRLLDWKTITRQKYSGARAYCMRYLLKVPSKVIVVVFCNSSITIGSAW